MHTHAAVIDIIFIVADFFRRTKLQKRHFFQLRSLLASLISDFPFASVTNRVSCELVIIVVAAIRVSFATKAFGRNRINGVLRDDQTLMGFFYTCEQKAADEMRGKKEQRKESQTNQFVFSASTHRRRRKIAQINECNALVFTFQLKTCASCPLGSRAAKCINARAGTAAARPTRDRIKAFLIRDARVCIE